MSQSGNKIYACLCFDRKFIVNDSDRNFDRP